MSDEETEQTRVATEAESAEGAAAPETSAAEQETVTVPVAELEKLKAECAQGKTERDQLMERLARLQAEFENARKRHERERIEFRDYAVGTVVEQFLPVVDNFELALKAQGSADQLRTGVELIVKQMEEILRQLQVLPVASVGQEFDPRHHEALGTVEREDMPDQHVAEEVRRGYRLRDKLLRPALVRIVSNPKQKSD